MSFFNYFCVGSLIMLLTACGGGGGGSSDDNHGEPPVLTGQLIDSAVSGIRYVTETRSGITDDAGQFEYLDSETVSFYIGDQLLGDAQGAATITLFDLVDGIDPLVGNALKTTIANMQEDPNRKHGPNFSTVINLATLLQTLDKDGNPDNGIEIPVDVAALFAADSVDFNQHWEHFKLDHGFRKVLAETKSRAFLDSARQIRKPWLAMAHLYASLGLDSKLRPNTVSTEDILGRGTPDFIDHYTFDEDGKLTRHRHEYSRIPGGTADPVSVYTYDVNRNLISYGFGEDADGRIKNLATYTYDVDGNLTREEVDVGNDGSLELLTIYGYDPYGNMTRLEAYNYRSGAPPYIWNRTYDTDGRLTREEVDDDGDGATDSSSFWSYSSDSYQSRTEDNESGIITTGTSTYILDPDGNLLRTESDYDNDGTLDSFQIFTNDVHGNWTLTEVDSNGNGSIDATHSRTYDANDNLIREEEWDNLFESGNIIFTISTFDYDTNGNLVRDEKDYRGDGTPDELDITTYEYDADGNWIRSVSEDVSGDMNDTVGTSSYDASGNPIRRTYDFSLDGIPDVIYTWDYAVDTDGWWSVLHAPLEDRFEWDPMWHPCCWQPGHPPH